MLGIGILGVKNSLSCNPQVIRFIVFITPDRIAAGKRLPISLVTNGD